MLTAAGYGPEMQMASSHNPDTLLQWIWVVLAYGIVVGIVVVIVGVVVALAVRAVRVARSSGGAEDGTRR